jgi:DNA-binding FadR family transcriptional regulator
MVRPPRLVTRDDGARVSRAEGVAMTLAEDITRRGLAEGHRLGTKDDLRKQYGVAAGTVNEALRILDIRGLVEVRPGLGGGVFVAVPPDEPHHGSIGLDVDADATIAEWREIRDSLEPVVCRKAARRCSSRDVVALRRVVDDMRAATDDPTAFMGLNFTLHRLLAEMGDNPPLTRLYLRLLEIIEAVFQDEVKRDPAYDPPVNLAIHEELVEAIIAGSPEELEKAIKRHTPTPEV